MCPVCSAGVIVGLGLSRWLRVDDSITGVWVGALILAFSIWTYNFLFKKSKAKPVVVLILILFAYWFLTFIPLYATNVINNTCKTIIGINRLVFGSILGIILTGLSISLDKLIRLPRKGKVLFPYQKVVIPLSVLSIASLILNTYCK